MRRVPLWAAVLTAAGALPFVAGAWLAQSGELPIPRLFGLAGHMLLATYGLIILAYMAGCFWGFAASAHAPWLAYLIAVLPALYAFFTPAARIGVVVRPETLIAQIAGFALLLPIDWWFQRRGWAPDWWMTLRLPVSAVVIASLLVGLITL